MKKIVAGIGFEITGTSMLICSSLLACLNIDNTTEWVTKLGRYWQTVINMGLLPIFIIGFILLFAGIGFSLWGVFSKSDK